MMNKQEKMVQRVGLVGLAVAVLAVAPLVFAATRPVVPVAVPDEAPVAASPRPSVAPVAVEAPKAVPAKKEAPKAVPAKRDPHAGQEWRCETRTMGRAKYASSDRTFGVPQADGRVRLCGWEKKGG